MFLYFFNILLLLFFDFFFLLLFFIFIFYYYYFFIGQSGRAGLSESALVAALITCPSLLPSPPHRGNWFCRANDGHRAIRWYRERDRCIPVPPVLTPPWLRNGGRSLGTTRALDVQFARLRSGKLHHRHASPCAELADGNLQGIMNSLQSDHFIIIFFICIILVD